MLRPRLALRAALGGAVALFIAACSAAAAIVHFGWFDIAASSSHLHSVRWLLHRVMISSVVHRSGDYAPSYLPAEFAAAGLCEYREHCQSCHGGPATARDDWANGLSPPPPYLLDTRARWTAAELHWIVANGVKMTAMPAWKASMSDREIWSVVAFLEVMPDLPPTAYAGWATAANCPSGAEVSAMIGKAPAFSRPPFADQRALQRQLKP